MAYIIATDSSTTTTLGYSDFLYVPQGVLLGVASANAINGTSDKLYKVIVDGSAVSAAFTAIDMLNFYAGNSYNLLEIGKTGIVKSVNSDAIAIGGGGQSGLRNWGEISARGLGCNVYNFDNNMVENYGSITSFDSIGISLSESENATIINTGFISGTSGILVGLYGTSINVVNSGTVQGIGLWGAIEMTEAIAGGTIRNSGTITATQSAANAVNGSSFDDKLINSGDIFGDVQFGIGDDIYRASGTGSVNGTVEGGGGADTLRGAASDDILSGGDDADTLAGRGGDDQLSGGKGNDTLIGGAGQDVLLGGARTDRLFGGDQDDILDGQNGNDLLNGGRGDDILTGGTNADVFAFNRQAGDDVITDFVDGEDLIDLGAYGLDAADYASVVVPALSDAGNGATFLDLAMLGGTGSVLIEGLGFGQADASDFIL